MFLNCLPASRTSAPTSPADSPSRPLPVPAVKGGVCGAERSNSIASFQSIVPSPGHRCESLNLGVVVNMRRADLLPQQSRTPRAPNSSCGRARNRSKFPHRRSARSESSPPACPGVESSFGIFSSRMRTPSGLANARRCSTEVIADSNFFSLKLFVRQSQVLHQKTKRNLLRDFQRPLHLVHRLNPSRAVRGRDVDRRRSGASPFVIGIERRVHGIQRNRRSRETIRQSL